MRTRPLKQGEREAAAAAVLTIPTALLVAAAKGNPGALRRAGRNALVLGSFSAASIGGARFFGATDNDSKIAEETAEYATVSGLVGGFAGAVLTLAWRAMRK